MEGIINCFHFHNIYIKHNNNNKKLKAYSYGSTSNTYLLEDITDIDDKVIVKFYNNSPLKLKNKPKKPTES